MHRSALLIAAATAALALVAAPAASAAKPTVIKRVSALDAGGELKPGWRINKTYGNGDCWTWGFGQGALRCMARHFIYDPCYAAAATEDGTDRVVCMLAPWRRTVTEMLLPGGYSSDPNPNRTRMFHGLTVAGGRQCQFLLGATGVVDGKRVNYWCGGKRALVGNPSRRTRRWRIQEVRTDTPSYVKTRKVAVRIAWRYRAP